ncbi:rubrerythrin-like domain-containing protein [Halorubrum sp. LN27]|nr:rubrerythrin-like domain-containing protein [Halorubrum sp. LN27]
MKDIDPETDEEATYECFECGKTIIAETGPGQCPDCSGSMRNRQMPLE